MKKIKMSDFIAKNNNKKLNRICSKSKNQDFFNEIKILLIK